MNEINGYVIRAKTANIFISISQNQDWSFESDIRLAYIFDSVKSANEFLQEHEISAFSEAEILKIKFDYNFSLMEN